LAYSFDVADPAELDLLAGAAIDFAFGRITVVIPLSVGSMDVLLVIHVKAGTQ
jgi:hypothetical protein